MAVKAVRIEEHPVFGRRLGRHVLHDPRSRGYVADTAPVADVAHGTHGLPLMQTRGSCTAEALCGALDSDPDFSGHRQLLQPDADKLYDEEIVLEGGDPKTDDPGGSGLLICQVAQKAGLISSYSHAFGVDQALGALAVRPVITGVNWYDSMDRPDSNGLVEVSAGASVRGGHEFLAVQIRLKEKLVGCVQSWGEWGVANAAVGLVTGAFFMSFDTWDRLLGEQGDVTVPVPVGASA